MYFLFVRIPRNLGSREIVKHVEYLIGIHRHNVLQRHHVAQVCYLSILITDMTEPFVIFVIIACLEHSTFSTASLAFTHWLLFRVALLVVIETRPLVKCLLHSAQGIRTSEKAHGELAIQSLHVWMQMYWCHLRTLCYMLYTLLRHRSR